MALQMTFEGNGWLRSAYQVVVSTMFRCTKPRPQSPGVYITRIMTDPSAPTFWGGGAELLHVCNGVFPMWFRRLIKVYTYK